MSQKIQYRDLVKAYFDSKKDKDGGMTIPSSTIPSFSDLIDGIPKIKYGYYWGDWRLSFPYLLIYKPRRTGYEYAIALDEITDSARMLDCIMQVTNKAWGTPEVISGLCQAFNDILEPQEYYCSFGNNKEVPNVKELIKSRLK